MDAKEFLMIWAKECRKSLCHDCKFAEGLCAWRPGSGDKNIEELEQRVNRAISIAEKISHVKTYADDFFEKFPNAQKEAGGAPKSCRDLVYGTKSSHCMGGCRQCWNEPYKIQNDKGGRNDKRSD